MTGMLRSIEISKLKSPLIKRKSRGHGKVIPPWPNWYQPPIMPRARLISISATEIIQAACIYSRITVHELKSEMRISEYVRPRHAVAYVLQRYRPDMSTTRIAKHLGRKDHTTVLNAVKSAERLRRQCPEFAALVSHLEGVANGIGKPA